MGRARQLILEAAHDFVVRDIEPLGQERAPIDLLELRLTATPLRIKPAVLPEIVVLMTRCECIEARGFLASRSDSAGQASRKVSRGAAWTQIVANRLSVKVLPDIHRGRI